MPSIITIAAKGEEFPLALLGAITKLALNEGLFIKLEEHISKPKMVKVSKKKSKKLRTTFHSPVGKSLRATIIPVLLEYPGKSISLNTLKTYFPQYAEWTIIKTMRGLAANGFVKQFENDYWKIPQNYDTREALANFKLQDIIYTIAEVKACPGWAG
jgi:hypothetical protein